tara:strand:- start:3019 stop:3339 length:321 start_codon:yes stop_codon:yes gene_type:complete
MEKKLIINYTKINTHINDAYTTLVDENSSLNLNEYNQCFVIVNNIESLNNAYKEYTEKIKTSILLILKHDPKKLEKSTHKSNFESIFSGISAKDLQSTIIEISHLQ